MKEVQGLNLQDQRRVCVECFSKARQPWQLLVLGLHSASIARLIRRDDLLQLEALEHELFGGSKIQKEDFMSNAHDLAVSAPDSFLQVLLVVT